MFDYLPFFDNKASLIDTETTVLEFAGHVLDACSKYNINDSNRLTVILDSCDKLEERIKKIEETDDQVSRNEMLEESQDLFQLLGYALMDDDKLFAVSDRIGSILSAEFWKIMSVRQTTFFEAVYHRDAAYRELKKLRRTLREQEERGTVFELAVGTDVSQQDKTEYLWNRYGKYLNKYLSEEQAKILISNCQSNSILMKLAPLYFCFAINEMKTDKSRDYDVLQFLTSLKPNIKRYKEQKTPADIEYANTLCDTFDLMMSTGVPFEEDKRETDRFTFDPQIILHTIEQKKGIKIQDTDKVEISKIVRNTFTHPMEKEKLKGLGPQLGEMTCGDFMYCFLIVFNGQYYKYGDIKLEKPRGLDSAIKLIYNNELIDEIQMISFNQDKYLPLQYQTILDRICTEYFTDKIHLCEELFWLITQYIPPHEYTFWGRQYTLYALIERRINICYQTIRRYFLPEKKKDRAIRYNYELRYDVLKIREELSITKEEDLGGIARADDFLHHLAECFDVFGSPKFREEMKSYCLKVYESERTARTKYKSSRYAIDVYADEIFDEMWIQSMIYLRRRIYSLIISFSKYIWPLDYKD